MKRSTERILTTHVGSLVRPPGLMDIMRAKENGQAYDQTALAARCKAPSGKSSSSRSMSVWTSPATASTASPAFPAM